MMETSSDGEASEFIDVCRPCLPLVSFWTFNGAPNTMGIEEFSLLRLAAYVLIDNVIHFP